MYLEHGAAARTVSGFLQTYLVERKLEESIGYLSENAFWVGTGGHEISCGREEIRKAIRTELEEDRYPHRLEFCQLEERPVREGCAVVLCRALLSRSADDRRETAVDLRVTACCTEEAGAYRIAEIHFSLPDLSQTDGSYSAVGCVAEARLEAERRFRVKSVDLMGRNIPGGMMGGYLAPGFPLYFINDQMLARLGFTYEEFLLATGGLVINCMHPDDRERVDRVVEEAFGAGREYEVQYRMLKKDGSYIWVNDIGKQSVAEDGRPVCLSVVRDVSAELEAREALVREAAERERQARRYDHLFQSVLCGIVQYVLDGTGYARFKNANREAMRIFGYSPEEFWAKDDWDLTSIIAEEDRARILDEISQLRAVGDKKDYEYRLLQKDGTPLWIVGSAEIILDSEGEQVVQSVFLDIDGRKRAERNSLRLAEQLEASREILSLALEHTTTCEFYYYPQTRLCVVPERTCAYYRCKAQYYDMPGSFIEENVEEPYREAFRGVYERIHRGERTASLEFRHRNGSWCRNTLTTVSYTEDGRPNYVIGIAEDISRQREAELALEEERSRDTLTGLYNRESGIRMVQAYLADLPPGQVCCLMLLDMDGFKELNQREGAVFADAVLQEAADVLRAETGPEDLQIRLGGDEFMLFIKDCDKARAGRLGPRIAREIRALFNGVGVSIGMCVTAVAEEYSALYRCAESTLKYVKAHGKGRAACYLDTSNELGVFLTQLYTDEHQLNPIDRPEAYREEDLTSFALDLLGKSKNLDDAVFLLLSRVGRLFGLDRVSILEIDRQYLTCRFTYQWARRRAYHLPDEPMYLTAAEYEAASRMYGEDGLREEAMCCHVPELPSCLHAGIWNYGDYVGTIRFERDAEHYAWTESQRRVLSELVKIIPSFIMKARADAVSQAKTDFLSRMSHEIRTPMNAISGMTTIAKSVLGDREKTLDCLEKIEASNQYLLELINDILDMSRIESGKLELSLAPTDTAAQGRRLADLLQPQAEAKGITLVFEGESSRVGRPILADELRINQVLINIIGNAIKFTPPGGRVTSRLKVVEQDSGAVTLRFSVEDTGIGIEPGAMERIFNAFEQAQAGTASQYGGTGLGLAISSRLVQMMGGVLEVSSQVGVGSEFYFTLTFPYADEPAPAQAPGAPVEVTEDFTGRRILLAEDNDLNLEIAQSILEMHGFQVEAARDGAQAVERFQARDEGYYDAVLMDIRMPVMDGLEATRRIRTMGRGDSRSVPILAMTANAFDEDTRKSLESGMDGHLSKPIQVDALLSMLSRCFRERGERV